MAILPGQAGWDPKTHILDASKGEKFVDKGGSLAFVQDKTYTTSSKWGTAGRVAATAGAGLATVVAGAWAVAGAPLVVLSGFGGAKVAKTVNKVFTGPVKALAKETAEQANYVSGATKEEVVQVFSPENAKAIQAARPALKMAMTPCKKDEIEKNYRDLVENQKQQVYTENGIKYVLDTKNGMIYFYDPHDGAAGRYRAIRVKTENLELVKSEMKLHIAARQAIALMQDQKATDGPDLFQKYDMISIEVTNDSGSKGQSKVTLSGFVYGKKNDEGNWDKDHPQFVNDEGPDNFLAGFEIKCEDELKKELGRLSGLEDGDKAQGRILDEDKDKDPATPVAGHSRRTSTSTSSSRRSSISDPGSPAARGFPSPAPTTSASSSSSSSSSAPAFADDYYFNIFAEYNDLLMMQDVGSTSVDTVKKAVVHCMTTAYATKKDGTYSVTPEDMKKDRDDLFSEIKAERKRKSKGSADYNTLDNLYQTLKTLKSFIGTKNQQALAGIIKKYAAFIRLTDSASGDILPRITGEGPFTSKYLHRVHLEARPVCAIWRLPKAAGNPECIAAGETRRASGVGHPQRGDLLLTPDGRYDVVNNKYLSL